MPQISGAINENCLATPEEFIRVARSFVGVPYGNQGRSLQKLDCGGLVIMVGRQLDYMDLEVLGYSMRPNKEDFEWLMEFAMAEVPKEETSPADLLAFDYGHGIQHIAIVSTVEPAVRLIHAKPKFGVVEQTIHGHERRSWVKTYRWKNLLKN